MYKNLRLCTVSVLLMSGMIAGCESLPKNVGMASSSSEIGVVYSATVKAIYPIFVKPDVDHSSSDGVGVLAEALTERVFGYSSAADSLSEISGEFARAATGSYEERYAGLYCHYILGVDSSDLLSELGVDDDRRSSRSSRRSRSSRDDDDFEDEDEDSLSSRRSVSRTTIDRGVEYRMNELWDHVDNTLGGWQGVTKIEPSQVSSTAKRIFVVNPCRNFRIGSKVSISKGDETVILQPSF